MSYDYACKYCGEVAYKTNGKSELICEPRAFTGKCQHPNPVVKEKLPRRNELCLCGSGIKFKKCCLNIYK